MAVVLLAAVVGIFVLETGDNGDDSADPTVDAAVDNESNVVELSVTEMGGAEEFVLRSDVDSTEELRLDELQETGDTMTLEPESGTEVRAKIVAIDGNDEQLVRSVEWEFDLEQDSEPINPAMSVDVNNNDERITFTVTSMGDAAAFVLRGDVPNDEFELDELEATGDMMTVDGDELTDNGTGAIVAIDGDIESQILSIDWNFD
ncbi:flagellin [Natronorubrum texcoconense]|uniref:flagellin n=1 Tax=Natronorubrum texcoconense TaxID=1095776 RepID=UPI001FE0B7C4|nr:flagellin [Natronorubrum texcoconense]